MRDPGELESRAPAALDSERAEPAEPAAAAEGAEGASPAGERARVERRLVGDPHLPADREPALCADVRAFPLADVVRWLHAAGKSGLLHLSHREHASWVWLHHGEVVFAASNQRIDRLGHSLVRSGVLSLEQLREAERGFRRGQRFGKLLVQRGLLSPRELWAGLQRQVEEIVRSLFYHGAGWLLFWEGELQPDNVVRLSLPTRRLVQEGMRWRQELRRFVAALCDPRVCIEPVEARREALSGPERLLFEALSAETSFNALCRRTGLDVPTAARLLQFLQRAGAVRILRAHDDPDSTQRVRRNDPAERLRAHVHDAVKLLAALGAVIADVEGEPRLRERFAAMTEEVAARFPGLLAGLRPKHGASLDPEHLIERALALPPERQDDVREALACLAEYLEFEVKNHPGIQDANALLASVEPLRARLHG